MNLHDLSSIYDYIYRYGHYNFSYNYPFTNNSNISAQAIPTNGTRIKAPHIDDIYLVDRGRRRRIQDSETYLGIFKDWEGIIPWDLQSIPLGPPIVRGTSLFKYFDGPAIYLLDKEDGNRWVKRFIVSANSFKFYHFNWNRIDTYSRDVFNPPNGSDIIASR